jgi:hypothetical protein
MWSFNEAISARVITADSDMIDVITFGKVGECFEECGTIVGNYFSE